MGNLVSSPNRRWCETGTGTCYQILCFPTAEIAKDVGLVTMATNSVQNETFNVSQLSNFSEVQSDKLQ